MSETQNEYETEPETDAEPTPGPWRLPGPEDAVVLRDFGVVLADLSDSKEAAIVAEANQAFNGETELEGHYEANARLIAAASTAAQEAREMGYDPVAAVGALPGLLAVLQDIDGMIEQLRYGTIRKMVNDALASAEGSGDE
jgi:pyruvate/2-oxoglutarate dehydrogenase complex dihydrolipoamide acyltransferase (E2) component